MIFLLILTATKSGKEMQSLKARQRYMDSFCESIDKWIGYGKSE